jgi:hypothetical protein
MEGKKNREIKDIRFCGMPDHVVHSADDKDLPIGVVEPDVTNPGKAGFVEIVCRQSFVTEISLMRNISNT